MEDRDTILAAYDKLEQARIAFHQAISEFSDVYKPNTVGLDYWQEGLIDVMEEIRQDIEENGFAYDDGEDNE